MKRILAVIFLILLASECKAAVGFSYTEFFGDKGTALNTTVVLSSPTATVITPSTDFEEVLISSSNAQWFYRVDGTTSSVLTSGFPVAVGAERTITALHGQKISIQSVAGASSQTLRAVIVDPK